MILLFLTPFITAAIGWLTNWVAIQMLFHPREPMRIFFWKWQGLIPARQQQLAFQTAEIIEREILQQHMILHEIRKIELGRSARSSSVPISNRPPATWSGNASARNCAPFRCSAASSTTRPWPASR